MRGLAGCVLTAGSCLSSLAEHFHEVWSPLVKRSRTRSQKVRERDGGHCQVPGCSHRGTHSHHVEYRSHGGSDDLDNQAAECAWHHLRCIHAGWLSVSGRAPDALRWFLRGTPWRGPGLEG